MSGIIQKGEEGLNSVIEYKVQKIGERVSKEATDFVTRQKESAVPFRVSDVVSQITGMKDVEKSEAEERLEKMALEKLEQVQEEAYKKAYELGQEEGRKEAMARHEVEIKAAVERFSEFVRSAESLKPDLLAQNEVQFIDMIYFVAQEIAMREISQRNDRIVDVLKECMKSAQVDENILIRMSNEDYDEFQKLKNSLPKEIEYLKDASIEAQDDIQPGGCIIETNFGVINATIEERIKKVFDTLNSKKPKVNDEIK